MIAALPPDTFQSDFDLLAATWALTPITPIDDGPFPDEETFMPYSSTLVPHRTFKENVQTAPTLNEAYQTLEAYAANPFMLPRSALTYPVRHSPAAAAAAAGGRERRSTLELEEALDHLFSRDSCAGVMERVDLGWHWRPIRNTLFEDQLATDPNEPSYTSNGGRWDGLLLKHWSKGPIEQFNQFIRMAEKITKPLMYTDEEYEAFLQDPYWTRKQTDHLMELVIRYDRRFIVIHDRFCAALPTLLACPTDSIRTNSDPNRVLGIKPNNSSVGSSPQTAMGSAVPGSSVSHSSSHSRSRTSAQRVSSRSHSTPTAAATTSQMNPPLGDAATAAAAAAAAAASAAMNATELRLQDLPNVVAETHIIDAPLDIRCTLAPGLPEEMGMMGQESLIDAQITPAAFKTVEDLKLRYYEIQFKLLLARNKFDEDFLHDFHVTRRFDYDYAYERKVQLNAIFRRSPAAVFAAAQAVLENRRISKALRGVARALKAHKNNQERAQTGQHPQQQQQQQMQYPQQAQRSYTAQQQGYPAPPQLQAQSTLPPQQYAGASAAAPMRLVVAPPTHSTPQAAQAQSAAAAAARAPPKPVRSTSMVTEQTPAAPAPPPVPVDVPPPPHETASDGRLLALMPPSCISQDLKAPTPGVHLRSELINTDPNLGGRLQKLFETELGSLGFRKPVPFVVPSEQTARLYDSLRTDVITYLNLKRHVQQREQERNVLRGPNAAGLGRKRTSGIGGNFYYDDKSTKRVR